MKIQEQSNQSLEQLIATESIDYKDLSSLANICLSEALIHSSYGKKKAYFKDLLTYSPKVFIPQNFIRFLINLISVLFGNI